MNRIRDLRRGAGLSQKEFADHFGIPVSTLRKWEQGDSNPPVYLERLLARCLPAESNQMRRIEATDGQVFFYHPGRNSVLDEKGNEILIQEPIEGVIESNLKLYLENLSAG